MGSFVKGRWLRQHWIGPSYREAKETGTG